MGPERYAVDAGPGNTQLEDTATGGVASVAATQHLMKFRLLPSDKEPRSPELRPRAAQDTLRSVVHAMAGLSPKEGLGTVPVMSSLFTDVFTVCKRTIRIAAVETCLCLSRIM